MTQFEYRLNEQNRKCVEYDSTQDTLDHIAKVEGYLSLCADYLRIRAAKHDASKLQSPEKAIFDYATPKLKALTYGSYEYQMALGELHEALAHHYQANSHHPEFEAAHEQWREVAGFEGLYKVSDLGRVQSVARTVARKGTQGDLNRKSQVLSLHLTPKGYLRLQLSKEGKASNRLVHCLVAEAFIPNPENLPQVNHKDGTKTNNRVGNLEWATQSDNMQHAYDTGLKTSNAKYIVTCQLPDGSELETVGMNKMAEQLLILGYKANAAGIWSASIGDHETHCGLLFKAEPIQKPADYSGIDGMTLLDLVEMLADWKAASERHADGDMLGSLEINRERFKISDQLFAILLNTVLDMKWDR